jgi:hypothetical protein
VDLGRPAARLAGMNGTTHRRPAARRTRLSAWWWDLTYRVGPNLWVVPMLMAIASIAAFVVTRRLDGIVGRP